MVKKILLVEDDADVLQANVRLLQRRDYTVLSATTVSDATIIMKKHSPDLLVLDIMLPDGSGYDVCKFFRENSHKPVIFLSAKGDAESKVTSLKCGADYFLTKPYNLDVFFAIIERLLEREQSNVLTQYFNITAGKLTVDLNTSTARLAGEKLHLTKIEFALLVCLIKNKNKIISNQNLYSAAWEGDLLDNKSTLKTHISRLRQKIDCENSDSYDIRAHYGRGYCLTTW